MSKTESQVKPGSRMSAGFAAGIVVILALTASVVGVELYGLNGITGKIVQDKSDDWSSTGPNAAFAAVMFYRDEQLRKFAKLELESGKNGAEREIAQKLVSEVDSFDSRITAVVKDRGINTAQLQVPSPNLYGDYATVLESFQAGDPATIDSRFRKDLAALEKKMSFQLQADAGQVADKKLRLIAAETVTHSVTLLSQLNRP